MRRSIDRSVRAPRLPGKERLILDLLASDERYGLELIAASRRKLSREPCTSRERMDDKGCIGSRVDVPDGGKVPYQRYIWPELESGKCQRDETNLFARVGFEPN